MKIIEHSLLRTFIDVQRRSKKEDVNGRKLI